MPPSSNWLALQKSLTGGVILREGGRIRKRRKVEAFSSPERPSAAAAGIHVESSTVATPPPEQARGADKHDTAALLRQMVSGQESYPPSHMLPGRYMAIDCEMVGIAGDPGRNQLGMGMRDRGDESSLARVSVVNYHGVVQLDVFVRQRERVTDWRTAVSGVRKNDMLHARPFSEVQKLVADLLQDRILVGHAVHNDLKALLLSHPHNMTRDTQILAGKHGTLVANKPVVNSRDASVGIKKVSKRPALRKLVSQELGIDIQAGEHSSVIDARATMALYRLHRKTWDKGLTFPIRTIDQKPSPAKLGHEGADSQKSTVSLIPAKRPKSGRADELSSDDEATDMTNDHQPRNWKGTSVPPAKRGVSSGISVVVSRRKSGSEPKRVISGTRSTTRSKASTAKWWGTLGN